QFRDARAGGVQFRACESEAGGDQIGRGPHQTEKLLVSLSRPGVACRDPRIRAEGLRRDRHRTPPRAFRILRIAWISAGCAAVHARWGGRRAFPSTPSPARLISASVSGRLLYVIDNDR